MTNDSADRAGCEAARDGGATTVMHLVMDFLLGGAASPFCQARRCTAWMRASFDQTKLPSFLALNASHRTIGRPHVGGSVQRYVDGKTPRPPTSNDLNAGDRFTAGPMPNGFKALFPESYVVYADCLGFHHAVGPALNAADYAPTALVSKSNESCGPARSPVGHAPDLTGRREFASDPTG
jgi:hypothetical protein